MDEKIIKFEGTEIEEYKFHQYKRPISINDIDIDEVIVSNKLSFGKQDFITKIIKEIRPLRIFFPEMSIYKRYSDKTKCMYFMTKDEIIFDKYMIILEKVSNIIKEINSELIYSKTYLKAEKICNTKDDFHCFYIPVILFDSVYIKYEKYYPKASFEKFIDNFFWRNIRKFPLKYKKLPFPEI